MRILLVEDDPALSLGIARALRREGWRVDPVGDTVAAQRAVFDFSYDLIVLDRRLPGRDGVDLLRQWRASGSPAVPPSACRKRTSRAIPSS